MGQVPKGKENSWEVWVVSLHWQIVRTEIEDLDLAYYRSAALRHLIDYHL